MNHRMIAGVAVAAVLLLSMGYMAEASPPGSGKAKKPPAKQQLRVPKKTIGALKASYNGKYDAPNRTIEDKRARKAERMSRPERLTRTAAKNELMGEAETTSSPVGTRQIASPVNEPQLRPARPKHRVSIDGVKETMSTSFEKPLRVVIESWERSASYRRSSDISVDSLSSGTLSSASSASFERRASSDSLGRPTRPWMRYLENINVSPRSSVSSNPSDGVDRLAGEGTRPASVELNRLRRDGTNPNRTAVTNAPAVLQGEKTPADDGS